MQIMAGELSTKQVKKFDGTNFLGWMFQMTQIFVTNEILSIVTGDRVMPADRESEEGKEWIRENAKAMFFISSSMEYNQLEPLLTSITAKQMWDRLVAIHSRKSASNKLMLTQKFHEYRMGPTDSVVQHAQKCRTW